jgi:hypothetical protein
MPSLSAYPLFYVDVKPYHFKGKIIQGVSKLYRQN